MSCNGCRVLRKGCNENCILRQSLAAIETPQAEANATLFLAKFFSRASLMSFLSATPQHQRPALFQSLLFEACGRTVNPVNGAVGLVWTGNWHVCQSAVETVLRGGSIHAMPELLSLVRATKDSNNASEAIDYSMDDVAPGDLEPGLNISSVKEDSSKWAERTMELSETTTSESGTRSASSETKLIYHFL